PHCGTFSASQAFCTGCDESADRPSIVVICLPATCPTGVWHEKARLPSMCTMQAPHRPVPQPNLVPVSLSSSRITHSRVVDGGSADWLLFPVTLKAFALRTPLAFLVVNILVVAGRASPRAL